MLAHKPGGRGVVHAYYVPSLSAGSPHGTEAPEVSVSVLRDGELWQTGCGSFEADGPAVCRAEGESVPRHLRPFLGEDPDPYLEPFPWIYSNPIRVGF